MSNELLLLPPVNCALLIPVSEKITPSELCNDELVKLKLTSLLTTTVSVIVVETPFPPLMLPVPVQPVRVNVFASAPPVRLATSMLESVSVPSPVNLTFVKVKLTLPTAVSESVPSPPLSVSLPWPLTSESFPSPPNYNIGLARMLPSAE